MQTLGRITCGIAVLVTALSVGSAIAEAVDLRSWDQKLGAAQRFVVLNAFNDEAVLDKETQIVWERTPSSSGIWIEAWRRCARATTGGRRGWRLPSVDELTSLFNATRQQLSGYLPFGHPFVGVHAGDGYWTATLTPALDGSARAFKVQLDTLDVSEEPTAVLEPGIGWCVRGGTGTR